MRFRALTTTTEEHEADCANRPKNKNYAETVDQSPFTAPIDIHYLFIYVITGWVNLLPLSSKMEVITITILYLYSWSIFYQWNPLPHRCLQ